MSAPREFVLTDVRVSFWRMVVVLFKLTLAAIPAALLAWLVIAGLTLLAGTVLGFSVGDLLGGQGAGAQG